ncbi:MAG TPA: PH domain-containing protein [Actinoplanes sp.]|nr:PH domain-containing protein [Actinoplanes sp.]
MAFPDNVLAADEQVVLHLRPHWRVAVRPGFSLFVALGVFITAWVMLPTNSGGRIGVFVIGSVALVAAAVKGVWPLLVWRTTHWVFTDERVLLQEGVIVRGRRDLPLDQINDHTMTQSLVDRMFGTGTMAIDALGEQGPAVLTAVPGIQSVHNTLYLLIEDEYERADADESPDERA